MLLIIAVIIALVFLPWPVGLVVIAAGAVGEGLLAVYGFRYTKGWRARVGVQTLVGQSAEAITALAPNGQVRLNGEIWAARARTPVGQGATVRIEAVNGLTLTVVASD